jgi:hypothetical protein
VFNLSVATGAGKSYPSRYGKLAEKAKGPDTVSAQMPDHQAFEER